MKVFTGQRKPTQGQILMMFALALPLLLIMLGLALDGSRLYFERRHAQIAADAGARGAAFELLRGNNTQASVDEASATDAAFNGYDSADPEVSVTAVLSPTAWGADYVAVTVTDEVPTTLFKIFSKEFSTVAARAVAGVVLDTDPICVLALNEDVPGALTVSGSASQLNANCQVMSNSDNENSITANGGACIDATAIGFVGSGTAVANINGNNCLTPNPAGQAFPEDDPFAYLADIDISGYPTISNPVFVINEGNVSSLSPIQPGYYCQGIAAVSTVSIDLYMAPGVYIVDGFQVTGNVTIHGEGVTIIDIGGSGPLEGILIAGTVNADLSAPTNGDFENVLFYGQTTTDSQITGTSTSTFEGAMYFPESDITFGGNQNTSVFGMVIGDTVTMHGTPGLNVDYTAAGRTPTLRTIALVE